MYLLIPSSSTILTSDKEDIQIENGPVKIVWYTMDGYKCKKRIDIRFHHSGRNIPAFEVTSTLDPKPHVVSFLITNGVEWKEPYVKMRPIRFKDGKLREDKILSVKKIFLDQGFYYDNIPIGAIINGYLAYPTHTVDGKMIDPMSKLIII